MATAARASAAVLPDGIVAIVKRDCPTCALVAPVLADLARRGLPLHVYSQDDPSFPPGVRVVDDRDLTVSWHAGLTTVPTRQWPRPRRTRTACMCWCRSSVEKPPGATSK